jgi:ABC-type Fe3+-siderophore transport system permease subunit
MSSAITTELAVNARVQSAVAAQQAHEANVTSCMAFMSGFQGHDASVQEAHQYSSCVSIIYPSAEIGIEIPAKALMVTFLLAALIGMAIAGYKRFKHGSLWGADWVEIIIFYPLFGCIVCGLCWLIYWRLTYLAS